MDFKPETLYIADLLNKDKQRFVIPEYQRPYRWGLDECETLWNDIIKVFGDGKNIEEYFLGSIVTYENKENELVVLEVIDGQQRITTFTLFFRALYESLKSENSKGSYPYKFGACLWDFSNRDDKFLFEQHHLQSKVITDDDDEVLKKLLGETYEVKNAEPKDGVALSEKYEINNETSNYAKNYNFFIRKIMELKNNNSLDFKDFLGMVLGRKLFVLLVVCDSQDSAMTIFNTLNSRGLPLSNADLIKNQIYKAIESKEKRKEFANIWKNIESKMEDSDAVKGFDFLFLQYMYAVRGNEGDNSSTTPGVLNFFTKGKGKDWLHKPETMPFISNLANFWIEPKTYLNDSAYCYLSVLNLLKNDAWKGFVSCLVWRNKECFDADDFDKEKFSVEFNKYLPILVKFLTFAFLNNNASTSVVRNMTVQMCAELMNPEKFEGQKTNTPKVEGFSVPATNYMLSEENFFESTRRFDSRKLKYLLFLYACIYSNFEKDINPENKSLEVEHILPKAWQNANFKEWDKESHDEYLEQIGNKILLDRRSNSKCAENFFAQKQNIYKESKHLKEVADLGNREKNVWDKEDIKNRNQTIYKRLKTFLES